MLAQSVMTVAIAPAESIRLGRQECLTEEEYPTWIGIRNVPQRRAS